jgi:hypothetical protein
VLAGGIALPLVIVANKNGGGASNNGFDPVAIAIVHKAVRGSSAHLHHLAFGVVAQVEGATRDPLTLVPVGIILERPAICDGCHSMGMGGGIGVAAKGGLVRQVAGAGIIGIAFLGVIAIAIAATRSLGSGQTVEGVIGKRLRLGIAHLPVLDPLDVAQAVIGILQVLQGGRIGIAAQAEIPQSPTLAAPAIIGGAALQQGIGSQAYR